MKKYLLPVITFFIAASFTSCLKDNDANVKYGTTLNDNRAVFFALGSGSKDTAVVKTSASPSTSPTVLDEIQINLAGSDPLDRDITVNIAIDNSLLVNSGLTALPAGSLSVPTTVILKKGTQFVRVPFTIANTSVLSLTANYGFGLVITSVDNQLGIINNKRLLRVQLNIKNIYDGIYSVESGLVTRYLSPGVPSNDAISGPLAGNPDVRLITTGATTLSIPIPGAPGALYWSGGASQVAGIDGITLSVNPATNAVTVTSAGNASLMNWAGHINSYDPATKTFKLAFRWNPTANVREYEVILKYKGPRP